jgi:PAB-dependent poly(A)-specific ribonuclease subunit 2
LRLKSSPFSTIGMPYYHEKLLSAWPSDYVFEVGHMTSKLDPDILKSMAPASIGYRAPNPRKALRNQVDRTKVLEANIKAVVAPKFLSERSREKVSDQTNGKSTGRRISDAVEAFANATLAGSTNADVPIEYRNVEIKYSKFGVQDFDFQ